MWMRLLGTIWGVLKLIEMLGKLKNIDPGEPNVPEFGRQIYALNAFEKHQDKACIAPAEISLKRKFGAGTNIDQSQYARSLVESYKQFKDDLSRTVFACLILDYDATLCSPDNRFKGLPDDITSELVKLLNQNVVIGVATGRGKEVRIAMLRILAHRYAKRTPQQELFAEVVDPEPKRELYADIGVLDGARLFLLHEYERPYYYGFDSLVDAGGGNIEQFLKSADEIVSTIESRLIRKKPSTLDAADQHKLIKNVAEKTIREWDFPMCNKVKTLINFIGKLAQDASLTPNAYLDHGANAYGVLQSDFDKVEKDFPVLAQALHYAAAYNAVTIIPSYGCKNQLWTLLELGGYPIILHGLTFKRGGFVEGTMSSLNTAVVEAID